MKISRTLTPLAFLALALAIPSVGRAEPVPGRSFVEFSEAIVVGRLTITSLHSTEAEEGGTGFVTVEEVVAGPVEVGQSIPFEWHARFDTGVVCPLPFRFQPLSGVLGVWFDLDKDGTLRLVYEFWNLENPDSLKFHARELKAINPRTERISLLLSIFERRLRGSES